MALERRHWRLLASEPILGIGIFVAAALLLAYAPPIDLAEQVAAVGAVAPARVRETSAGGSQLSVAGEAGPYIVNALVSPRRRRGERRVSDARRAPASGRAPGPDCRAATCVARAAPDARCSRSRDSAPALVASVDGGGHAYRVWLPIRYQPGPRGPRNRCSRLVEGAQRKLRSVAIYETLGSGTGSPEVTSYQVAMPDRFAYQLSHEAAS